MDKITKLKVVKEEGLKYVMSIVKTNSTEEYLIFQN